MGIEICRRFFKRLNFNLDFAFLMSIWLLSFGEEIKGIDFCYDASREGELLILDSNLSRYLLYPPCMAFYCSVHSPVVVEKRYLI